MDFYFELRFYLQTNKLPVPCTSMYFNISFIPHLFPYSYVLFYVWRIYHLASASSIRSYYFLISSIPHAFVTRHFEDNIDLIPPDLSPLILPLAIRFVVLFYFPKLYNIFFLTVTLYSFFADCESLFFYNLEGLGIF